MRRVIVKESNKDYVVSESWSGKWTCSCPLSMFKKQKCRHIFFAEKANLQTSNDPIPYDPGVNFCGCEYINHHFKEEEWTDPATARAYSYIREGEIAGTLTPEEARRDWAKELSKLRKPKEKKPKPTKVQ